MSPQNKRQVAEEQAIRWSASEWQVIFDAVGSAIFLVGDDYRIIGCNRAAREIFFKSFDCPLGEKCYRLIHGTEQPYHACPLMKVKNKKKREAMVFEQNGRWFEVTVDPILDETGHFTGSVHVVNDITGHKQIEDFLRASESLLAEAQRIGKLGHAEWIVDKDELTCSTELLRIFELPLDRSRITKQMLGERIHPEDIQRLAELDRQAFAKRADLEYEYRLVLPGNRLRWIYQQGRVTYAENGKPLRIINVFQDITERKQAEESIQRLNAELEARVAERTRQLQEAQEQLVRQEKLAVLGQLAGGVGHELRNPLAVISNAVCFLRLTQPEADPKVSEYLDVLERETRNAEKIISDLLDFARVKPSEREAIPAAELAGRVFERYPVPEAIRLILDLPPDLPPLWVDARQMEQVLGNLVLNAYQAMPSGGQLSVSSYQSSVTDHCSLITDNCLLITVRDAGPGIPPENMGKLFEPLFTTKSHGIGLGLAVSKKLVEANGGRIEVKSEPGKGAAFTLILPTVEERKP